MLKRSGRTLRGVEVCQPRLRCILQGKGCWACAVGSPFCTLPDPLPTLLPCTPTLCPRGCPVWTAMDPLALCVLVGFCQRGVWKGVRGKRSCRSGCFFPVLLPARVSADRPHPFTEGLSPCPPHAFQYRSDDRTLCYQTQVLPLPPHPRRHGFPVPFVNNSLRKPALNYPTL